MITSERVLFGAAASGSGLPDLSKVGAVIDAGKQIASQVTGKTTTAPPAGTWVLAPGAEWSKVKIIISMPQCKAQYDALMKEYKRRKASLVNANVSAKIKARQPLTQSDLTVISWMRVAEGRLTDFRSMFSETPQNWPTKCPPNSGVGIPGYKGGVAGTGVSKKYVYAGVGVLALGAVAIWLLK